MAPYHVQVYVVGGTIFRGFFYKDGPEFSVSLECEDSTLVDCGSWPSICDADEFARISAAEIVGDPLKTDPLHRFRTDGSQLVVAFDQAKRKWTILAGYPPWRWLETGVRCETQKEARRILDAQVGKDGRVGEAPVRVH